MPIDVAAHPECATRNLDRDVVVLIAAVLGNVGDVDGSDYLLFQARMSGPGVPPPPGSFTLHGV
ncbi:MAG: hypothetical protein HY718_19700 [Planctomycetes bacterium]|nr:hypothetical protein [Planctomycetota bacterium]